MTGLVIRFLFAADDHVRQTKAPVVPLQHRKFCELERSSLAQVFRFSQGRRAASSRIGARWRAIVQARPVQSGGTMVDSRKEKAMTNGPENPPERVQGVEQKLDALRASVGAGFEQVDRRFEDVDAALLEQRQYTEFAYEKLDSKMDAGFSRLDQQMDAGFFRLDQRMDAGFAQADGRFAELERKMDGRFARLERKIDQIVDLHLPKTPPDRSDSE